MQIGPGVKSNNGKRLIEIFSTSLDRCPLVPSVGLDQVMAEPT